mgnify:CR=1 FL=1
MKTVPLSKPFFNLEIREAVNSALESGRYRERLGELAQIPPEKNG